MNAAVSRVVRVETLVDAADKIRIAFVVLDEGGSTDVSPTQSLVFTMYQKGEMFDLDAAFDLGPIVEFKSSARSGAGVYEAVVRQLKSDGSGYFDEAIRVDAGKALVAMKSIKCPEFECAAAEKFGTTVAVTRSKR